MAEVRFVDVEKVFEDGTRAVHNLNLSVDEGLLLVLVGPSGCGKTTALRMVAGLEEPTSGSIEIGGRVVNDVDPRTRDIAMVFQNYALYPHMSVHRNIEFPLRLQRIPKEKRAEKVKSVARTLGLEKHLDHKPAQLSGGQRQRVAMGRALVREPSVFLMDEPLSNLDAKLRVQMRAEISSIQRQLGVTSIYVTHDQVEAMTVGDRVAVMRGGILQQVGAPQQIYERPANLFVAGFVGAPPMNLIYSKLTSANGSLFVSMAGRQIKLDETERANHSEIERHVENQVVVGVRPERLMSQPEAFSEDRRIRGEVRLHEALGSDSLVHLASVDNKPMPESLAALAHGAEDAAQEEELEELEDLVAEGHAEFVARIDPRTPVRQSENIEVGIAPGSLQLFDGNDGLAIR